MTRNKIAPFLRGWLTDRFGVSWPIMPHNMLELVSHPAAMRAMMTMVKLDIAAVAQG